MSKSPPKAYRDARFIGRPDARTLRILAEYVEPESRFSNQGIDRTIVFFGSARALPMEAATPALATMLTPLASERAASPAKSRPEPLHGG